MMKRRRMDIVEGEIAEKHVRTGSLEGLPPDVTEWSAAQGLERKPWLLVKHSYIYSIRSAR